MASKIITIVGITGKQGTSVATAFLNDSTYKIRGISRDPSKPSGKEWSDKGVEMVAADLDDVSSLKTAFTGSNIIFGVTDFWQQMKLPANQKKAEETGKSINVVSHDAEIQQGKNIVDAANATADSLELLVLSVLTDSRKWSNGKITWNYHFEGKWRIVEYLQDTYPDLYKKSSFFQPASYVTNFETGMSPRQAPDGSYIISFPVDGNKEVPMFHPEKDSGVLVKALVEAGPGKNLMGYSCEISHEEIARVLSEASGKTVKFQRCSVDTLDGIMPGGLGRELGEMFEYMSDPGYYGGEAAIKELGLIRPNQLGNLPLTDVRDYLSGLKF